MKKVCFLFILGLLVGCMSKQPQDATKQGWSMVYKHDKLGKALHGSKDKVIEAVRNGLSIKIAYGFKTRDGQRSIEHAAEAQFLTILTVKDSTAEVFAQISPIMRQGPYRLQDTVGIKLVPGFKWLTAIGTNGMSSNVMVNTFADSIHGSNENRSGAMWFVDYPPDFKSNVETLLFLD